MGSKDNPIKFYLVPAQDRQALLDNGQQLKSYLEKELGLAFIVELPTSFITSSLLRSHDRLKFHFQIPKYSLLLIQLAT